MTKKENYLGKKGLILATVLSGILPVIYNLIFVFEFTSLKSNIISFIEGIIFFLLLYGIYNHFFPIQKKQHVKAIYFSLILGIIYGLFGLMNYSYYGLALILPKAVTTFIAVFLGGLLKK